MSNHSGSYILNEVLNILDNEYDFFKGKEPREIVDFFRKIDNIGNSYDTNTGEILEEIGQKYNICYICMLPVKELPENGVCLYCEYEDQEAKSKSIELNMEELTIEEIANQKEDILILQIMSLLIILLDIKRLNTPVKMMPLMRLDDI